MSTPIAHQIYSFSQVAEMFAFPDNTGAGQIVGVLGWGSKGSIGIDVSERPNVEIILIGDQTNGTVSNELMMDTGILKNFVPDAVIKLYLAISDEAGIVEAVQRATTECNVTTCSFGHPYQSWDAGTIEAVDAALEKALATGVTPCFASGDFGASRVAYPASSPYALAVGGVFVPTNIDPTNSTAQVWWNTIERKGSLVWMASGGGVNTTYENAVPGWQTSLMPVMNTDGTALTGRAIPDVAGFGQGLTSCEGTSACSPLWASLIARINCELGYNPQTTPVGVGAVIHRVIYDTSSSHGAFTDIIKGNNIPPGAGQVGYEAHAGWDACTGWGTPIGTTLAQALQNALASTRT
ncbi:S8 family serine peptidase [Rhodopila sp.]|uniref:S8 family serine peptidase n=1 Tax=Rhodopila sp. TaxID=2480087 RepID=UPI002D13FE8E|nr:S8 family serine peptidase [Rhodopila sp.]HVZ06768.1 S8 family serine peptidase [Rhodopila sp.]